MLIKIPELNNFSLVTSDEVKLEQIECQAKIIDKIDLGVCNFSVIESKIGKLILFNESIQGGYINYYSFWGGLPYTRYFALSFIIKDNIDKILVLGLGSGSVINDLIKIDPFKKITSVEIYKPVIDSYYKYFKSDLAANIEIICYDAYEYLFKNNIKQDLIILDIFQNDGIPEKFTENAFLLSCYNLLETDGVLAINFFGTEDLQGSINGELFKLVNKLKQIFPTVYIFPVLYGAYEYYRLACNLRYNLSSLTNIVLLASKKKQLLTYNEMQIRSKLVFNSTLKDIYPNFNHYARDNKDITLF